MPTEAEAIAYIDGFTDGGIFFATSLKTFSERKEVMDKIKNRVREAQRLTAGKFLPGSCAHCGYFHSSAVCPTEDPLRPCNPLS